MAKTLEHFPKHKESTPDEQDKRIMETAQKFFIDSISTDKPELLKSFSLSELLDLYAGMMNGEPTVEGFNKFLADQADKSGKNNEQTEIPEKPTAEQIKTNALLSKEFKKFLLEKLPRDLPVLKNRSGQLSGRFGYLIEQDDLIDELSVEELLDIHKKRKNKTILGFYVSGKYIEGDKIKQSRLPSTIYADGDFIEIPAGYAHYNLNPKGLYKGTAGGPNFLYLVEGSTADRENYVAKRHSKASGGKQWLISASPLKIRAKIELTPHVIKELESGFE